MKKNVFLFLILIMLPALAVSASAATLNASPDGMSLTEALASAADGDTIVLADGVYAEPAETFPIEIDHSVTVCAAEGAHPVIQGAKMKSTIRVDAPDVTLKDLDIQMLRHGLYVTGDRLTADHVNISLADEEWRTSSCGVWLAGVQNCTFTGCAFTGCGIAVAGPPIGDVIPDVPKLTGMFEVGETADYFTNHTIENCTVNGKPLFYCVNSENVQAPSDAGEILIANCTGVTVDGADVSHSSMGLEIVYCSDITVRNTTASYCGIFGIYLAKNADGLVEGCYVEQTNHGIDIRASQGVITRHSRAYDCDQGIFYSIVTNGLVQDCTVEKTGQGYFFAGGHGSHIDGCLASGCENGMNIQKEQDMLITDCVFEDNTICAARLDGSATVFVNNTMTRNWVGVMAYGGVAFSIADNTITESESCPLYLRDIAYSRISGNTITGAIQAEGEMNGTLLNGNTLDQEPLCTKGAVLRESENTIGGITE